MAVPGFGKRYAVLAQALILGVVLVMGAGFPQTAAAQSESERGAVLAANGEFYRAFREGDLKAMNKLWGHRGEVAVEHPSGWKLVGRRDVMHSWARLMAAPPNIHCIVEGISFAKDTATVYCDEQLNPGSARMKNIFHREDGAWKMIYHGPVPKDETVS